ncbi:MAG: quinoprotein dehydrogenase-associated putative ABC transporter substrate-binding protein [Proteobacteria bacterium]|nr:quinoprotein dehydrogenase-associated putative ABC transporter substrate-binding protein [Pseudomonadota bacterium]
MRLDAIMLALALSAAPAAATELRICADPNNLPFSNRAGEGFENKIAALLAHDLHRTVSYYWAEQHEGFLNRTLKANRCDVVMAAPPGLEDVKTTAPYYGSTYVFVARRTDHLEISTFTDPRLRTLRIGVPLIGDDASPPAEALGRLGIVDNVHGFVSYGDYGKPNPPARLIEAVADRDVDLAVAWGPTAGYFARHSQVPLTLTPIDPAAPMPPLVFRYAIAVGTRPDDTALRKALDDSLKRERSAIHSILVSYGVPLVPVQGGNDG